MIICYVFGICGGVNFKVFCVFMISEFMDVKCVFGSVFVLGN